MEPQPHIHCPRCRWEPSVDSRWVCALTEPGAGCGTRRNTFWTAGCCPGCGHFWSLTQCLSCKEKSPHQDWYHYPQDDAARHDSERALEATG